MKEFSLLLCFLLSAPLVTKGTIVGHTIEDSTKKEVVIAEGKAKTEDKLDLADLAEAVKKLVSEGKPEAIKKADPEEKLTILDAIQMESLLQQGKYEKFFKTLSIIPAEDQQKHDMRRLSLRAQLETGKYEEAEKAIKDTPF